MGDIEEVSSKNSSPSASISKSGGEIMKEDDPSIISFLTW